jgi:hypothetical protein
LAGENPGFSPAQIIRPRPRAEGWAGVR